MTKEKIEQLADKYKIYIDSIMLDKDLPENEKLRVLEGTMIAIAILINNGPYFETLKKAFGNEN